VTKTINQQQQNVILVSSTVTL